MKKKEMEKIPYLTLKKKSRKKAVKYVGTTTYKNIGHEPHLILEVYKNEKNCLQVPIIRYAANKKDWAIYFPEEGIWTHQKITSNKKYGGFAWETDRNHSFGDKRENQNVLFEYNDLKRIKEFFENISVYNEGRWWEFFVQHEQNIVYKRGSRRRELRGEKLKQRAAGTPELQENEILEWAERTIFKKKHFLYYKKKGRYATICCSKCGGVKEGVWKTGESYESRFQVRIEEPKDKRGGKCPLCGAYGIYKPQGRTKSTFTEKSYAFTADRYRENGVVLRYMELEHSWHLEEILGDKGEPEMHGAYEEYAGVEIAREYLEPGKKPQRDFQKRDGYRGKNFWDDCNLYGMKNIPIYPGSIHPKIKETLKGTFLEYSGLEEYAAAVGEVNILDYLERYTQFPQIEILTKLGLIGIVREMIKGYCGIVQDSNAKRVDTFLGINKSHVRDLIAEKGNTEYLKVLKWEKNLGKTWTPEQVKFLAIGVLGKDYTKLQNALNHMSMEQFRNRMEKYAKTELEAAKTCSNAAKQLQHTTTIYLDYLEMRISMGYDLNNSVYVYPRNLETAHQKMVLEQNKNELDERLKQVKNRYPNIRKNYRKLRNQYFYESGDLIIRPVRSAEEIVIEGRVLHHCVGGDGYLRNHNKGIKHILVLRAKEEQDLPYVTVEIEPESFKIIQWYGAYDKKPEEKNLQKWLDTYRTWLRCNRTDTGKDGKQQIEVRVAAV